MIYRLRKNFIKICTVSFAAVFLVLLIAIYLITAGQTRAELDMLADIVSDNNGRFPAFDELRPRNDKPEMLRRIDAETPFTTRFFTVMVDKNGLVTSADIRSVAGVNMEDAEKYALTALSKGGERGWVGVYRYKKCAMDEGQILIFVNGASMKDSNRSLLLVSALVFVGGSLAVLLLVILISRSAVKPAAESYEKQKQFITDANHELKTPLTLIHANLDIMESEYGSNEWLQDIREETGIMTELVGQLVNLARMDEEDNAPEMEPFDLSGAVSETTAFFAPAAERKGLNFSAEIAPDISYTGNEAMIMQLVCILLDNAVKYCDDGGEITVRLSGGRHPELRVENSFAAVGSTDLDRLFDRFYRADKARTYGSGFGIGLSIAKAVAEKHKGSIRAENTDNRAIRFCVKL